MSWQWVSAFLDSISCIGLINRVASQKSFEIHVRPQRVMVLGATGTAGQATVAALLQRGHDVTCFIRAKLDGSQTHPVCFRGETFKPVTFRYGDVTNSRELKDAGFCGESFDALVSCLASRTGAPDDAWAIDYQAHSDALKVAHEAGVKHMVLLSAICVQKPKLAFQFAKLAFEKELTLSGLTYSIVRPTALFKSLSGQIDRLRNGKRFLMFGNGELTACKPISDGDLGAYMAQCLEDTNLHNRVLPIGGPGPAITPKQQAEALFAILGREPRYMRVPVAFMDLIINGLTALSWFSPRFARKAEFARIGRYYATESMLHINPDLGRYDAATTPTTGTEDLFQFYAHVIKTKDAVQLGDHAIF
jgi:divinyl chlorophyllide a 8-vinyl-reductase